jgi:phage terminase small subunit
VKAVGRNAKPIDILEAQGKKHLTKNEIDTRKKSELKFGDTRLKCPDYIKQDPVALKKWRELSKEYKAAAEKNIEIVKSSDAGIMAMYCKTFSEYQMLLKAHQRVSEIHYDCRELDEAIDGTYIEDDKERVLFSYKVKKQLRDLFAISGILAIETAINKKMDMLIKMEDRLFLNPLAKVKNVPKPTKDDKPASKYEKFGAGVNG